MVPMKLEKFRARLVTVGFALAGCLSSSGAPAHVSCYEPNARTGTSLAAIVDDVPLVLTAQLFPLDERGDLVGKESAARQTEQTLANMAQVLAAAHSDIASIVKLN